MISKMPDLPDTPLFEGIEQDERADMLRCLQAKYADFPRGSSIFVAGSPAERVGLVLRGAVQVVRDDVLGNRSVLTQISAGGLFGEAFACAGAETLPVSVIAVTDCGILLLDYRRIIATCTASCRFHKRLIKNMLQILAQKNILLSRKIEVLSARSLREKLLAYLMEQAPAPGREFTIPYNRQQLADYLAVDRSALSREMGSMQEEGLIRFNKNCFMLLL